MPGLARVLVVEDDDMLAQPLLDALIDDGYEVVHAHDGAAAIAAVRQGQPDVILLDLMMPGYSGWDFLSMYRETPGPHAPVLVVTAAPPSTLLGVEASVGVEAVVRKPYSLDRVLALVKQQIIPPGAPAAQ